MEKRLPADSLLETSAIPYIPSLIAGTRLNRMDNAFSPFHPDTNAVEIGIERKADALIGFCARGVHNRMNIRFSFNRSTLAIAVDAASPLTWCISLGISFGFTYVLIPTEQIIIMIEEFS